MTNLVEKFLLYFQNEADNILSKNTLKSYEIDLKQFCIFLENEKIINPEQITKEILNRFKEELKQKELSLKSINRKITAINRFFYYLGEVEKITIKAKVKIFKIQSQDFDTDLLSNNDVDRVLRSMEKNNDIRAKTLILTLFYTGARISEALQIRKADINKDKIQINGKGSKYRYLYIPKKLKKIWAEYLKVRQDTDYKSLFTSERGSLTRATVNTYLKYYAGQARVKKDKVHPHALRHLYTKNIYNLGLNPRAIGQLLGHSIKSTTEIYLTVSEKELLSAINKLDYTK